jgi:hypothetical protein
MTGLTTGYAEALSCSVAGSALSDTATAAAINTAQGAFWIPVNWWGQNKGIHLHSRGIISTPSSSTATLTMGICSDSTQGTVGTPKWTNASAITPVSSASNWFWELEMELICSSVSGANAVVVGMGELTLPASATQMQAPYAVGSTTGVNVPISTGAFLEVYAAWTTAVSGDTLTCETVAWIALA